MVVLGLLPGNFEYVVLWANFQQNRGNAVLTKGEGQF